MFRAVARSIRLKLALVVLATTLTALLVAGVALVINDLRAYRQAALSDLLTQADILGRASAPALAFDDPKAAREYLMLLKAKSEIASAAIYNARGKPFATYAREVTANPAFPRLPETDGSRVEGGHLILFQRVAENSEILGTVYLKSDYNWLARLTDYLGIFAIVTASKRPLLKMSAISRGCPTWRACSLNTPREE
jgi:hypothetical protein